MKDYKNMFADINPNPAPSVPPTKKQFDKMFADSSPKAPQKSLEFGSMFTGIQGSAVVPKASNIPSLTSLEVWLTNNRKTTTANRLNFHLLQLKNANSLHVRDFHNDLSSMVKEITENIQKLTTDHVRFTTQFNTYMSEVSTTMQRVMQFVSPQKASMFIRIIGRQEEKRTDAQVQQFINSIEDELSIIFHNIQTSIRPDPFIAQGIQNIMKKCEEIRFVTKEWMDTLEYFKDGLQDPDLLDAVNKRIISISMSANLCNTSYSQVKRLSDSVNMITAKYQKTIEVNMPTWRTIVSSLLISLLGDSNYDEGLADQLTKSIQKIGNKS